MESSDRYFADLTPEQFEEAVHNIINRIGGTLTDFTVQRRERIAVADGTYEIDVSARFEALGASFLVLIECKHHKAPVKRDHVQILYDRLRTVGAQKGILFSTSRFQAGTVKYAKQHGIALVHVADGSFNYIVKAAGDNRKLGAPYAASLVSSATNDDMDPEGEHVTYSNLDYTRVMAILDFWKT